MITETKSDGTISFVIVAPRQGAGGPIVLHALCHALGECGYDAKFFLASSVFGSEQFGPIHTWTKWLISTVKDALIMGALHLLPKKWSRGKSQFDYLMHPSVPYGKRKITPFVDDRTIVIYPEGCYGNPLHAKNVVRWFLYYNRYPGDEKAFGKNDLFYCFREVFNDSSLNPEGRVLRLVHYDLDLYRRYNNGARYGRCYILRKGRNRSDLPKEFDGPIVDELAEWEKVRVFNECEYCISYDMQSAYSRIAAMCGCISVKIPEEGKTREDYEDSGDLHIGVAYGFEEDELSFALKTRDCIREYYERANAEAIMRANTFAQDAIE
ncbi:MAG: hypothetical protein IJ111_09120, partial [Eggerthellaceae bacterium]|nr:hypothetical protein [Eggerthellaceae bacterium]